MEGVGFHFASFPTALATESFSAWRFEIRLPTRSPWWATTKAPLRNCFELARQQARVAKALAAPRTREALTELGYILEDQVGALANATDDDKADAATWAA